MRDDREEWALISDLLGQWVRAQLDRPVKTWSCAMCGAVSGDRQVVEHVCGDQVVLRCRICGEILAVEELPF